MQGLIAIIYMFTQVLSPTSATLENNYDGLMPETVVTAPRYEGEDVAYSDMMPEVVVVADRCINQPRYADSPAVKELTQVLSLLLEPKLAQARSIQDFEVMVIPSSTELSGGCDVAEGDTIREDVTVTGGSCSIDGVIDGDLAVMGGSVEIDGMVDGDVAVFGGNLDILGTVTGDAAVFGGRVYNKGTIEGDIFVVGGTVSLDSGSVVEGDISMVGGSVDRDTNAVVLGDIESVEIEVLERLLPKIGRIGRAFQWTDKLPGGVTVSGFIGIAVLLVIYVLNLLALLIFPRAIDRIIEKVERNVWASVGFGLGIQILYIPLIVLFAVSIIGIPVIPLFMLAVCVAALFGFSALSLTIGERVIKGLNWQVKSRFGVFSLGWLAIMFIQLLYFILCIFGLRIPPVTAFGAIIMYVTATIGLGGVIYALVKKEGKANKTG